MSIKIDFEATLEDMLACYSDYETVELEDEEWDKLVKRLEFEFDGATSIDRDDIEIVINTYLHEIGFDYSDDENGYVRVDVAEYIADALEIDKKDVQQVADYFEMDINEVKTTIENYDMRSFPDFDSFFDWMHEDMETYGLIKLLKDETDAVKNTDASQWTELEDGTVIFIYA